MIKLVKKAIPVVAAAGIFLNIYAVARADVLRAPGGGTIRVVVIGVNHYSNLGEGAQLRGAAPDALDIAAALEKDGVHTVPILDGQVTRQRIVDAMNDLIKNSKKGDLAIISYAGHGMQTPEYPRWKGLSRSGASEQIALSNFSFAGNGAGEIIVNIEMRAWLSKLDAKGVDTVLVMDSCFGGGMRGVDPRSGELRVREVKGAGDAAEREKFTGIPMTDKEARADVALMPHVTFLSGATSNSVVPEMSGLPKDPSHPRGALSYYVARALEGGASVGGVVTRKSLFQFVLQNVRQATNGRQAVDIVPRSADPEILGKQIFVFGEPSAPPSVATSAPPSVATSPPTSVATSPPTSVATSPPTSVATTPPTSVATSAPTSAGTSPPTSVATSPPTSVATSPPTLPPTAAPNPSEIADAVHLAIVNGEADAWSTIEKGRAPLVAAPDRSGADLVWDVGKHEALARGDLVMQRVDGSMIGDIADRTWAIRRLRAISQSRVLLVGLASGGSLLTPGDQASATAEDLHGEHLTAFNIAADGTVQMLYPSAPGEQRVCPDPQGDRWSCGLEVEPPFGADTIVALATSKVPTDFVAWLKAHHAKRDAALIPAELGRVLDDDPSARLGFAGVFTNSTREIEKERP